MKRIVALALVSVALVPAALARQDQTSTDVTWRALATANGCIFYEGDLLNMVPEAPRPTIAWSGACKPGEAITGKGTLTRKRDVNGFATTRTYKGQVVGGYLDGRITITDSYVGIADPRDKETGTPHTFSYRMGCMVLSGTDGALESGTVGGRPVQCLAKTANIAPANAQ